MRGGLSKATLTDVHLARRRLATSRNCEIWCWNRRVSQMRTFLAACRESAVDCNTLPELLCVFEHKNILYIYIFMLHIRALWYFDTSVMYPNDFVQSNLLKHPHVLCCSNICEILLYQRQLVVITYELIYVVKIFVKQDYCPILNELTRKLTGVKISTCSFQVAASSPVLPRPRHWSCLFGTVSACGVSVLGDW